MQLSACLDWCLCGCVHRCLGGARAAVRCETGEVVRLLPRVVYVRMRVCLYMSVCCVCAFVRVRVCSHGPALPAGASALPLFRSQAP